MAKSFIITATIDNGSTKTIERVTSSDIEHHIPNQKPLLTIVVDLYLNVLNKLNSGARFYTKMNHTNYPKYTDIEIKRVEKFS